jgi:hypothetical protein
MDVGEKVGGFEVGTAFRRGFRWEYEKRMRRRGGGG